MLKVLLSTTFLMLSITGFTQRDSLWQDSILSDARLFFSEVDRIELIKLEPYCETNLRIDHESGKTKEVVYCREESILHSQDPRFPIDVERVGDKYQLQSDEIDSLFNMLYIGAISHSAASCYNPRHGIIFYNSSDSIIGFLEICFECNRIYSLPGTPNMGPLENKPFKQLKELFREKNLVNSED
ncbi:MAG: hypothetical protein AB8B56_19640 [Crocinitomicaceae bacterium]